MEEAKHDIFHPSFCVVQNDWETSLQSQHHASFWVSLIQHHTNDQQRIYADGTVDVNVTDPTNKQATQCEVKMNPTKGSPHLNCNLSLHPLPNDTQHYYAQFECDAHHVSKYQLIPSYQQINTQQAASALSSKRTRISRLDATQSSHFKRWYVAAATDGGVHIYDVALNKLTMTCSGHNGNVTECKFFPMGDLILSGDTKGALNIHAIADAKGLPAVTFTGEHKGDISCVAFVDDGKQILSGATDNTVILWNCSDQKKLSSFGALGLSTITQIEYSDERKMLTASSSDGFLSFYDVNNGHDQPITSMKACNGNSVECFAVFNGSKSIIVGSDDGMCYVYDIRKLSNAMMNCVAKIQRDDKCVKKIVKTKDNENQLILCNPDGSVWKYEMNTGGQTDVNGLNMVQTRCEWTGNDQFGVNDFVVMHRDNQREMLVATKDCKIKKYFMP